MKLIFLGAGAAFTMENWQSNMLLEAASGKRLLIDCGSDIRWSLKEAGYGVNDVDAIYISHLHADHTGGIEFVAFCTFFNPMAPKPQMFINRKLGKELWERTLQGGMGSIQGQITSLDTYFNVTSLAKNECFIWEETEFRLVQVIHYMDGFDIVPSYGLLFEINGTKYFITTDAQHAPHQIQDFYNISDVIFQDCETSPFKSGVHAHYTELVELDDTTKAKMHLYHYQDGDKPNCKKDGFGGWVKKGQVFEL